METKEKTSEFLINEYKKGERFFSNFDFSSSKFENLDLSGSVFEQCFFDGCEFNNTVLKGAEFNKCNLKSVTISNSDLVDSKITECSIEGNLWDNVKTEHLVFLENGYYGLVVSQDKFEDIKKDFEENYKKFQK